MSGPAGQVQSDARVGTLLEGKYRLVSCIGRGGMGEVFEGLHLGIGRRVAIKLLQPQFCARADLNQRFEAEARLSGQLHHENVVAVYDVGTASDGARFLVMEYLEGEDCAAYLAREGRMATGLALELMAQACRGISAAHAAGIVHRDLKPANLFLTRRANGTPFVKVLDFGIAKLRAAQDDAAGAPAAPTLSGAIGTPHYMAPEQVLAHGELDARTDVYGLGVVLFELLTGTRPFAGTGAIEVAQQILHGTPARPAALRPELSSALCAVVTRAMARTPEDRFESVEALARALCATERTDATLTSPPSEKLEAFSGTARPSMRAASVPSGPIPTPPPRLKKPGVRARQNTLISLLGLVALAGAGWALVPIGARPGEHAGSFARSPSQNRTAPLPARHRALSEQSVERPNSDAIPASAVGASAEPVSNSAAERVHGKRGGAQGAALARPPLQADTHRDVRKNAVEHVTGPTANTPRSDAVVEARATDAGPDAARARPTAPLHIDPDNPYR